MVYRYHAASFIQTPVADQTCFCTRQQTVHIRLEFNIGASRIPYPHFIYLTVKPLSYRILAATDIQIIVLGIDIADSAGAGKCFHQFAIDISLGFSGDGVISHRNMCPLPCGHKVACVVPRPCWNRIRDRPLDFSRIGCDAYLIFTLLVEYDLSSCPVAAVVDPGLHGQIVGHLQAGMIRHLDEVISIEDQMNCVRLRNRCVFSGINRDQNELREAVHPAIIGSAGVGDIELKSGYSAAISCCFELHPLNLRKRIGAYGYLGRTIGKHHVADVGIRQCRDRIGEGLAALVGAAARTVGNATESQ